MSIPASSVLAVFFVLLGLFWAIQAKIDPQPQPQPQPQPNNRRSGQFGNPGLKLRLTRKGTEYLRVVGVKLLNEQLSTMRGFHFQNQINEVPGITGMVYVNDLQTIGYRPPTQSQLYFVAPRYIVFGMQDMAITLNGRFLGESGPFQMSGRMQGQLFGLSITLVTQFRHNPFDGQMVVNVADCSTQLRYSHFNLEPEGLFGPILKLFETQINDLIRQRIPDRICQGIRSIVERNSPQLFQQLTYASVTEHFNAFNGTTVIEKFIRRFTEGLFIDGRMVSDPVVTPDYFETQQKGELRYANSPRPAPFFAQGFPIERDSDRMIYLYASEYTLNSLIYHAYQTDKLNIHLEQSTLPDLYRGFLRTTCPDIDEANDDILQSICVGKLVPAIAKYFPNTTTKFTLLPHELPEMRFLEGLSTMDLKSRVITYVLDPKTKRDRQILVSSADGVADIKLVAGNGKISGDLNLRKLNIRLHRSAIPISAETIEQLAPLAKTFLTPELARGLHQGLPYPLKDTVTFIRPQLVLHDGYMRLATDFELEENSLRRKMTEAFERIRNSN